MSPRTVGLSAALADYVETVGLREHPELRALRLATDALADGGMRSSAEQAQLLAFLIELIGARRGARDRLLHRLWHARHGAGPAARAAGRHP